MAAAGTLATARVIAPNTLANLFMAWVPDPSIGSVAKNLSEVVAARTAGRRLAGDADVVRMTRRGVHHAMLWHVVAMVWHVVAIDDVRLHLGGDRSGDDAAGQSASESAPVVGVGLWGRPDHHCAGHQGGGQFKSHVLSLQFWPC